MDNIEKELEEVKKEKDILVKEMLDIEWIVGSISVITFLILIFISSLGVFQNTISILIGVLAVIILSLGLYAAIKIEQIAGYYECRKCGHKYVPTYSSVLWAMHFGRTRYMQCPKCGNRSWNKKRICK